MVLYSKAVKAATLALVVAAGALFASQDAAAQMKTKRINPLIEKLESGGVALTPDDWVFLDNEHQPYLLDRIISELNEMGRHRKANGQLAATPVIRLPMDGNEDSHWLTKQLLDSGVMAVVFPHIESRAQAEKVVSQMRYPPQRGEVHPKPEGTRGFGPQRAAKFWGLSVEDYLKKADVWPLKPEGELLAILQIESLIGAKKADEIISTPGVGAILLGPSDLGMSLGVGPAAPTVPPETEEWVQKVLKSCQKYNVTCIYPAVNGDKEVKQRIAEGFKMLLVPGR